MDETRIGDSDWRTIAPPSIFTSSLHLPCFRQHTQTFTIQFCLFPFQSPPCPCSLQHSEVHTIQYSFSSRPMYLQPRPSVDEPRICDPPCFSSQFPTSA